MTSAVRGTLALLHVLVLLLPLQGCFPSRGELIFTREHCIDCHSFKGQGGAAGPDLTGIAGRRSLSWIREKIRDPRRNSAQSEMPSYRHLRDEDMQALLRYLQS